MKTETKKETIKGYLYKSNANNEVIIPKNDINYNLNKMIYIIVAPSDPLLLAGQGRNRDDDDSDKKLSSKFYIGISSQNTPLSISEGMPHTMTLSRSYPHQIYQKMHSDPKKDLQLNLNVLMGNIDIFASPKYLSKEDIDNININQAKYNINSDTYDIDKIRFKLPYFSKLSIKINIFWDYH